MKETEVWERHEVSEREREREREEEREWGKRRSGEERNFIKVERMM